MSSCDNSNIKKNYIVTGTEQDILSACTAIYTNSIENCSGTTLDINSSILSTNDINATNITLSGVLSACTGVHTSNIYGCSPITIHDDLLPIIDGGLDLGSTIKRFRDINTISGTSTVWTSTDKIITPQVELGLDGLGNNRTIDANNSIIQNDILNGGAF